MWLFWCQFSRIESERGRKDGSLHLSDSSRLYHRAAAVCRQTTSPQTDPSFWQHANLEACDSDESQYLRQFAFYSFAPPPLSSRGRVQTQTEGKGLGMSVYQRFWLDSFFGGFLSPFFPIFPHFSLRGCMYFNLLWWALMSDGCVCVRTCLWVHNAATVEKSTVGRHEYFNDHHS